MPDVRESSGLQIIFAIFLGLMVTAFVGVGVNTVYPSPQAPFDRQIRELDRQKKTVMNSKAPADLTPAERTRIQEIEDQRNNTQDASQVAMAPWGRNASIILILFATLAMAISLIRSGQLPVLSNGLLLGGVFTMVYGVGLIIVTATSAARFTVMTIAFVITLALGYARFVRSRVRPATQAGAMPSSGELIEIDQRVRALEKRMDDAASALGHRA